MWDDDMVRYGQTPCRGCMDAPAEARYGYQCRRCWTEEQTDLSDPIEAEWAEEAGHGTP